MLHRIEFFSEALQAHTYFLICTPTSARKPLPAVILLRGEPEEWLNPQQDHTRGGRELVSVSLDCVHKGFIEPLAFVLPRTTNQSMSAYISHGRALRPDLTSDSSYIGNGHMDRFFDQDLIPRCRESGLIDITALSIDGFSLGGASSIYHALRRPDLFKSCGSFDGSFLVYEFDHPGIFPETPSDLRLDSFPYLFDFPPHEGAFRAQNPIDIARSQSGQPNGPNIPPSIIHRSNQETPSSNGWRVETFLRESGVHNHAQNLVFDKASTHAWHWVDEHLYRSLPFHSHFLRR